MKLSDLKPTRLRVKSVLIWFSRCRSAIGESPQRRQILARVRANLDVLRRESDLLNTTMTKGRDCSLNLAKTYTDTLQSKANQIRRFYTNSTWTPIYPSTGSTWTVLFLLRSRHTLSVSRHINRLAPHPSTFTQLIYARTVCRYR